MKILYTTDLHGNILKYNKIFEIAKKLKVELVINGGDLYPKNIKLHDQCKFITGFLDSYFKTFEQINIPHLLIPGNDDLKTFDELLEDVCKQYKNIFLIQNKKIEINGYEFIGFDLVSDYPFRIKDRCRKDSNDFIFPRQYGTGLLSNPIGFEELDDWVKYANGLLTIHEELERLPKPSDMNKTIYVMHMPPSKIDLDMCGDFRTVGSDSEYNFIKKYQPLMTLHGHIHENYEITKQWKNNIEKTICIQPGQMNPLSYTIIDLDNMNCDRCIDN